MNGHGPEPSEQEYVLGAEWERHRPAVFGVAYRLLGSVADAEDVAQDVWLRAAGTDLQEIDDLRAWLVTVAARRSYDILKSARFRRETYVGPWLPEPLDRIDLVEVGGELALVFRREGRVHSVDTVQITDGLITAYRRVLNPDKLVHV